MWRTRNRRCFWAGGSTCGHQRRLPRECRRLAAVLARVRNGVPRCISRGLSFETTDNSMRAGTIHMYLYALRRLVLAVLVSSGSQVWQARALGRSKAETIVQDLFQPSSYMGRADMGRTNLGETVAVPSHRGFTRSERCSVSKIKRARLYDKCPLPVYSAPAPIPSHRSSVFGSTHSPI